MPLEVKALLHGIMVLPRTCAFVMSSGVSTSTSEYLACNTRQTASTLGLGTRPDLTIRVVLNEFHIFPTEKRKMNGTGIMENDIREIPLEIWNPTFQISTQKSCFPNFPNLEFGIMKQKWFRLKRPSELLQDCPVFLSVHAHPRRNTSK